MRAIQVNALGSLVSDSRLKRMMEVAAAYPGEDIYTIQEMMGDLRRGIFAEIYKGDERGYMSFPLSEPDLHRRNLQFALLRSFLEKVEKGKEEPSDIAAAALGELKRLEKDLKKAMKKAKRRSMKDHWRLCYEMVRGMMED